jgi:hypothetical protein
MTLTCALAAMSVVVLLVSGGLLVGVAGASPRRGPLLTNIALVRCRSNASPS